MVSVPFSSRANCTLPVLAWPLMHSLVNKYPGEYFEDRNCKRTPIHRDCNDASPALPRSALENEYLLTRIIAHEIHESRSEGHAYGRIHLDRLSRQHSLQVQGKLNNSASCFLASLQPLCVWVFLFWWASMPGQHSPANGLLCGWPPKLVIHHTLCHHEAIVGPTDLLGRN